MKTETYPTIADLDAIRLGCRRQVVRRSFLSGAIAATPFPLVDAAADLGILMRLLPRISQEFALDPKDIDRLDPESQAVVYAAIKSVGETFVGQVITQRVVANILARLGAKVASKQAAKIAPIIGNAASASISFALMRGIGMKHVEDCYQIARIRAEGRMFGPGTRVIDLPN